MNCVTQNKAPHKSNKKRLFISLMGGSFAVVALAFLIMWKVAYPGLWEINEYLPLCFGLVLGVVAGLLALGNFSMLAGVLGWPVPKCFSRQTYALMNMLFYVAVGAGKLLGIDRRRIEGSFVAVSNQIVKHRHLKVPPDRLLVVTPHCLQLADCPHKITRDPHNCKR